MAVGSLTDQDSPQVSAALEAAVGAFARDGLHGTSMDAIAAAAGLTKPALYRRFGSKDALFERVVDHECTRLTDHLLSAYALALELPVEERLGHAFEAFFRYAQDRPHGFRLLFCTSHHRSSTVAERVDVVRRQVTDRVAAMVRHELAANGNDAPVAADVLATVLVGMGEHTARRLVEEASWDRAAVVRLLARFAAAGGMGVGRSTLRSLEKPSAVEGDDER
jgi:AcrR family transcriptional regulator